jgi:hypothetical protein
MVVKIRFGRGPVVSRRPGKNSRIATLAASLLTMVSIICASLGMWRIGTDLDWAGNFVFPDGFLSHWQVWIGAAIAVQYAGWRLVRHAKRAIAAEPAFDPQVSPEAGHAQESQPDERAIANV